MFVFLLAIQNYDEHIIKSGMDSMAHRKICTVGKRVNYVFFSNVDQDPGQKITTFISNHLSKSRRKKIFSDLYLNLRDKLIYSFRLEK